MHTNEKPAFEKPATEKTVREYQTPELIKVGTLDQMQGHGHHAHDMRGSHHHHD